MDDHTDRQQLQGLLDRQEVTALIDHYVSSLDEQVDLDEEWARSLFTEDVRLEHEIAVLEGISEVAGAHRVVMARWQRTFHLTTNHRIDFDGGRACLTARLLAVHVHPGEHPPDALVAANVLEADAVRTPDGWRFERFAPRTVWRTGQPAAPVGTDDR